MLEPNRKLWLPSRRLVLAGASSAALISALQAGGLNLSQGPIGSCPQGIHAGDGCPGAPAGTPQLPNLLNSYLVRPSWNVAAVDYHVGIPTGTVLTDWQAMTPTSLGNPGGSVSFGPNNVITIGSGSYTFNNIDFSQHGGASLFTNSATAMTFNNCNWAYSTQLTGFTYCIQDQGGAQITVTNCKLDLSNATQPNAFFGHAGPITVTYSHLKNTQQHFFECSRNTNFTGTLTAIIKYNLFDDAVPAAGAHVNYFQVTGTVGTGTVTGTMSVHIEYNTTYQTSAFSRFETVTISNASPALVTLVSGDTAANTNQIKFATTGTLPAPLVPGQIYFVSGSGTSFNISATSGGAAINTTSPGSGTHTASAATPSGEGFQWGPDTATDSWPSPTFLNNTMIAILDGGNFSRSYHFHDGSPSFPVVTGQCNNNYFDPSGAIGTFYPGSTTPACGWTSSGNINMNDGSTITPA